MYQFSSSNQIANSFISLLFRISSSVAHSQSTYFVKSTTNVWSQWNRIPFIGSDYYESCAIWSIYLTTTKRSKNGFENNSNEWNAHNVKWMNWFRTNHMLFTQHSNQAFKSWWYNSIHHHPVPQKAISRTAHTYSKRRSSLSSSRFKFNGDRCSLIVYNNKNREKRTEKMHSQLTISTLSISNCLLLQNIWKRQASVPGTREI